MNPEGLPPEKELDCPRRKIASFDPNNLRRRSETFDQTNEIPVRTDQSGKLRPPRPLENEWIGRAGEAVIVNAFQAWENVGKPSNQSRREVLVEKDPH
jgi:hypothetical protein